MPDYIPPISLPTGLAEEAMRLRSQQGAPWARLAASLGQDVGGIGEAIAQKINQQRQNAITPEQMKGLQQFAVAPAPISGEKQTFQGSIDPTKNLNPAQRQFLVDTMSQERTEKRMMALQGLKGQQGLVKDHTLATEELIKNYPAIKKMGFQAGDMVPNRFISDQAKPKPNSMDESALDSMAKDAAAGKLAPKQFASILGRGNASDRSKLYEKIKKINPNFDAELADQIFSGKIAGGLAKARIQQGQGHTIDAAAATVEDNLDRAEELIQHLSPSSIEAVNSAWRKGLKKISGDDQATELLTHLIEAREQQAIVLANGHAATDVNKKEAQDMLSDGLSKGSFRGTKKAIVFNNESRVQRLMGEGSSQEVIHSEGKSSPSRSFKKEKEKSSGSDYVKSLGL